MNTISFNSTSPISPHIFTGYSDLLMTRNSPGSQVGFLGTRTITYNPLVKVDIRNFPIEKILQLISMGSLAGLIKENDNTTLIRRAFFEAHQEHTPFDLVDENNKPLEEKLDLKRSDVNVAQNGDTANLFDEIDKLSKEFLLTTTENSNQQKDEDRSFAASPPIQKQQAKPLRQTNPPKGEISNKGAIVELAARGFVNVQKAQQETQRRKHEVAAKRERKQIKREEEKREIKKEGIKTETINTEEVKDSVKRVKRAKRNHRG